MKKGIPNTIFEYAFGIISIIAILLYSFENTINKSLFLITLILIGFIISSLSGYICIKNIIDKESLLKINIFRFIVGIVAIAIGIWILC